MNSTTLKSIAATIIFATLAIPIRAQESKQIHYSVTSLGTLGGKLGSSAHSINDIGWIAGDANLTGDNVEHAALWRDGVVTDLGTLGGSNSNVVSPVKNNGGLIAGFAQTSSVDPLGETFCTFTCNPSGGSCDGSNHSCLGFLWRNGVKEPLGTLGGNNSAALGVNNLGLVVGTAENIIQDPACMPPQVLDYKAVTWLAGRIHELRAFSADPIAAAAGVNDNNQVVGGSGNCGSGVGLSPIFVHAVLWQSDSVTDLGNLGGSINNVAFAINGWAQIVGASDLAGDNTGHAFLWQKGVMADLGTLTGDFSSVANGINNNGQVVGQSCNSDFSVCRAFLWQAGAMTDLNTLIPVGSSLFVFSGFDINDRGEIVGIALDQGTGEPLAFLAVPCGEEHVGDQGCLDAAESAIRIEKPKIVLPENVRHELQRRMHFGRL